MSLCSFSIYLFWKQSSRLPNASAAVNNRSFTARHRSSNGFICGSICHLVMIIIEVPLSLVCDIASAMRTELPVSRDLI
jgi:hypothetical protein